MKAELYLGMLPRLVLALALDVLFKLGRHRLRYQPYPLERGASTTEIKMRILHGVQEELRNLKHADGRQRRKQASSSPACVNRLSRVRAWISHGNTNNHNRP